MGDIFFQAFLLLPLFSLAVVLISTPLMYWLLSEWFFIRQWISFLTSCASGHAREVESSLAHVSAIFNDLLSPAPQSYSTVSSIMVAGQKLCGRLANATVCLRKSISTRGWCRFSLCDPEAASRNTCNTHRLEGVIVTYLSKNNTRDTCSSPVHRAY